MREHVPSAHTSTRATRTPPTTTSCRPPSSGQFSGPRAPRCAPSFRDRADRVALSVPETVLPIVPYESRSSLRRAIRACTSTPSHDRCSPVFLPGTAMGAARTPRVLHGAEAMTTTISRRMRCAAFVAVELLATTTQPARQTTGRVRRHVSVSRAAAGDPSLLASRWRPHTAVTAAAAATVHQRPNPRSRRSQRIQPFRQPRLSLRPRVRYRRRPQPEQSPKTSITHFVLRNASLVIKSGA